MTEVVPFEILFLDQPDFPIPIPFFQLLLSADSRFGIIKRFDVYESCDAVLLDKHRPLAKAMFLESTPHIIRYSDVQRTVSFTGENVDVVRHEVCIEPGGYGSPPSRGRRW